MLLDTLRQLNDEQEGSVFRAPAPTEVYKIAVDREKLPFVPTVMSILAVIVWAAFMLIYILFWSSSYGWLQNFSILTLSLVVTGGLVGLMWVYWMHKRDQ